MENKNQEMTVVINGEQKEVINLIPNASNKLAVVDFETLKKLTALLPSANFPKIKELFLYEIENTRSLEEMVELIRKEYNFHKTVNLIDQIKIS